MLVQYAEGGLARERGDLFAAEAGYRALLELQADFLPGQLELARALFENHKDREAHRAFQAAHTLLAEQGDQAVNVRQTVDAFLHALEQRRGWPGRIAVGPTYSTNLNKSSASNTSLLEPKDGTCKSEKRR